MRTLLAEKSFEKDMRRMVKRGKDLAKLKSVLKSLLTGKKLAIAHRDHKLIGNHHDKRECHIEPDWLLIYKITDTHLYLARTGTHAALF